MLFSFKEEIILCLLSLNKVGLVKGYLYISVCDPSVLIGVVSCVGVLDLLSLDDSIVSCC